MADALPLLDSDGIMRVVMLRDCLGCARRWWGGVLVATATLLAILLLVAAVVEPAWLLPDLRGLSPAERVQAYTGLRNSLVTALGGLAVLVGAVVAGLTLNETLRQNRAVQNQSRDALELQRRGQVTERFGTAIEQLAEDRIEIAIGAIYALEQIARDSPELHSPIVEILTAYLRIHAHQDPTPSMPDAQAVQIVKVLSVVNRLAQELVRRPTYEELAQELAMDPHTVREVVEMAASYGDRGPAEMTSGAGDVKEVPKIEFLLTAPRADLQAAASVLGRRDAAIDLPGLVLDLRDIDLRWFPNLSAADLSRAILLRAELSLADLTEAHLRDAVLVDCQLQGSNCAAADLRGANLSGAHLEYAQLLRADLTGANLSGAFLAGAVLWGAHLEGAQLLNVNWLTEDQVRTAHMDETTVLPPNLRPLRRCAAGGAEGP